MVKVTKLSPASKRIGVKKICSADYQQLTNINLTAMPLRGWGFRGIRYPQFRKASLGVIHI